MSTAATAYALDAAPPAGSSVEIVTGLHWVRQPLPMSLDHINVWLLHDDRKFAIVDTGIDSRTSRKIWQRILRECVPDLTVDKIVATHLHPDHVGLAGWLCKSLDAPLWMTRSEYLLCRVLCNDTGQAAPDEALRFYHAAGMDAQSLEHYRQTFGRFGKLVSPLPQNYRRIRHGDTMQLGPFDWEVVVGRGHSPEHACLYSEEIDTLISGDQILPTISSIVAVWPTEPDANPLLSWLDSCRFLQHRFADTTLVLPSHGLPFRGIARRMHELIVHHEQKLAALADYCAQPQRAVDVFSLLFKAEIDDGNLVMAIGETVAHFNYLCNAGILQRDTDAQGVHWYQHRQTIGKTTISC
ncbi:MAG: MBL fold metallo-hydrolase [Gammaproteobacteria bacterium]|nr:MBL fold metallo-hydrolase [Gammaproteobacteria bacterium]